MKLAFALLVMVALPLAYANECAESCQAVYYDTVDLIKAKYGHWGAAEDSPMRCPHNECTSDFYVCREKCDKANWDTCITACWNALQECCLNNGMSAAEDVRKNCISKCEAQLDDVSATTLPAAFRSTPSTGIDSAICTALALLIIFTGTAYAIVRGR